MPRYAYKLGQPYAGRLLAADTRPTENDKSRKLALLRLEFEIFSRDDRRRELRSLGKIACRDLVIGPDAASDNSVVFFAQRLGVRDPRKPEAWSARAAAVAWVEIVFGEPDGRDGRNRFADVRAFSPDGYTVVEHRYDLSDEWVKPEAASKALCALARDGRGPSASTIRRFTKKHLAEFGELLERRTPGGHRLINFALLRHLLNDPTSFDVAKIECAQQIRELLRENTELKRQLFAIETGRPRVLSH